jgi:hypothetical protein
MTIGIGAKMLEGFIDVSVVLRCGIYALAREGTIVYIGQGKKPVTRIEAHRSMWGRRQAAPAWLKDMVKGMLFDAVYVLPCRVEDLDRVERALIEMYRPTYNIKLKPPQPPQAVLLSAAVIASQQTRSGFVRRM